MKTLEWRNLIRVEPILSVETENLSAVNFKKTHNLNGSTPEPAIQSGDTGQ